MQLKKRALELLALRRGDQAGCIHSGLDVVPPIASCQHQKRCWRQREQRLTAAGLRLSGQQFLDRFIIVSRVVVFYTIKPLVVRIF